MIPNIDILLNDIEEIEYPTNTYKIEDTYNYERINGYTDDLDAIVQAIYLILSTERYRFPIYSWDYRARCLVFIFGRPP